MKSDGSEALLQKFNYPTPEHADRLPYMFGGLTFLCILLLMVSGMYLATYYVATPAQAYSSTLSAINSAPFWGFFRSIHYWTAQIVIILIALHVSRVIFTGSYKKPRTLTYLVGVFMLFIVLALMFIGTVLPLDQIGVDAFIRIQQAASLFGISMTIQQFLSQALALHISILVILLLAFFALHALLIEKLGISPKAEKKAVSKATAGIGKSTLFRHLKLLIGVGLILFSFIGLLSIISPAPLGHQGVYDPGVMITKPTEWIFFVPDIMLDTFGQSSLFWGPLLLFALLLALPLIDRSPYMNWRKRVPFIVIGIFILAWGLYFLSIDAFLPLTANASGVSVAPGTPLYWVSNMTATNVTSIYGSFVQVPGVPLNELYVIVPLLILMASAGIFILWREGIKIRKFLSL